MKGRVLAINTGSTSTKIGYSVDGNMVFEQNLVHSVSDLSKYSSVMAQDLMRKDAITDFLSEKGIPLSDIDIVMARAGLITPVETGVYEVNSAMRHALVESRNGVHACNLSGLIADEIAMEINQARKSAGRPLLQWLMRCCLRQRSEDFLSFHDGRCAMRSIPGRW